jgi:hypothetical protein
MSITRKMTPMEYFGRCAGIRLGIESWLRVRFGNDGLKLMSHIAEIDKEVHLLAILKTLETASILEEVRRVVELLQPRKHRGWMSWQERKEYVRVMRKCIEAVLEVRFGEDGLKLIPDINKIDDAEHLDVIYKLLLIAATPGEIRPLLLT